MKLSGWLVVACVAAAVTEDAPRAASMARQERVNPTAAAVNAFQQQVKEYVKLRGQAETQAPKLDETKDPAKIAAHETALAEAIRALRPKAQPGDIFVAEFRPLLLNLVREDFARRSAADRRALVQELPARFQLSVNMNYPTTLPLVTVPGKLLKVLPELPENLEYRILGRHLILRDVSANLVVDFVRDAVPTIPS